MGGGLVGHCAGCGDQHPWGHRGRARDDGARAEPGMVGVCAVVMLMALAFLLVPPRQANRDGTATAIFSQLTRPRGLPPGRARQGRPTGAGYAGPGTPRSLTCPPGSQNPAATGARSTVRHTQNQGNSPPYQPRLNHLRRRPIQVGRPLAPSVEAPVTSRKQLRGTRPRQNLVSIWSNHHAADDAVAGFGARPKHARARRSGRARARLVQDALPGVATVPAGTASLVPSAGTQPTPDQSGAGWSWPT